MQEIGKFGIGLANYLVNPGAQVILVIHRKHPLLPGTIECNFESHSDAIFLLIIQLCSFIKHVHFYFPVSIYFGVNF